MRKILKRISKTFALTLTIYLALAFLWAWFALPHARSAFANGVSAGLKQQQKDILLKVEDPSFYTNIGVDPFTPGQGTTTLTQNTVPLLLLQKGLTEAPWLIGFLQTFYKFVFRNFRKIDLGRDVMAVALAARFPKETIFDVFINSAYFGQIKNQPVLGLAAGAEAYFHKPLSSLTEDEFILLVSGLDSPAELANIADSVYLKTRAERIKKLVRGFCEPRGIFDNKLKGCS